MSESQYKCPNCDTEMSYYTTKHTGCQSCGFVPPHGAE